MKPFQLLLGGMVVIVGLLTAACTDEPFPERPAGDREVDLSEWFEGVDPADATFVVLDGRTGERTRFNAARAGETFLPASTFKIANALIALEAGVADGPEFTIEWDREVPGSGEFWIEAWSQDHTLRSAMANSVVWYYQELARRIGSDRMQESLVRFRYGNAEMGGRLDRFWLDGDLRISADEQVAFLRRLYEGELDVSDRSREAVKEILVLEETDRYRISGKTGTLAVTPTRDLAWLVGYVEQDGNTSFFALNMEGEQVWERWGPPGPRLGLVRTLLREVGALDAP